MIRQMGEPSKTIASMKLSCYNASEIRKLSAKQVTNPRSLDMLMNPTEGGLYDAAYGASGRDEMCSTCGQGSVQCSGHIGHIELPLPVYHPLFFQTLIYLLRGSCLKCHKLLVARRRLLLLAMQLEAVENGLISTVHALKEAENEIVGFSLYDNKEEVVELQEVESHLKEVYFQHYDQNPHKGGRDTESWSRNASELRLELVGEFTRLLAKKVSRCPHCGSDICNIRAEQNSKIYLNEAKGKKGEVSEVSQQYLPPSEVKEHIARLWENEKAVLSRSFVAMADAAGVETDGAGIMEEEGMAMKQSSAVDVLFLNALPVPPSRFRPIGLVNDRQFESPQTTAYSKVVLDCIVIRTLMQKIRDNESLGNDDDDAVDDVTKMGRLKFQMLDKKMDLLSSLAGKTVMEKLENAWLRLQTHVNCVLDSDLDKLTAKGAEKPPGIKQLLEKKDGLFRKHMMGKRVNFAARSVISPDPYIATNEIGVPLVFASRLTFPAPVTSWNIKQLRKAVINGPLVHPGATHVVWEGRTVRLSATDRSQREAVAKQLIATDKGNRPHLTEPKVVMRHLQTGDVMLVNRQPTLHKGSIMAHKVRVLPGEKTLRLHYANCKSYNADFDGDEMNAHFPQSELGRAEAYQLMLTDKQYLSGKDGKPLSCLIQDHMVAGVSISIRGRFFNRQQYQQLIYSAFTGHPYRIKLLLPAILKPLPLWSGKQIFSTLLLNIIPSGSPLINLDGKSKIGAKNWQKRVRRIPDVGVLEQDEMCESQVIIRRGELLCGVLDKAHYGATEYGLVHATYELYGGEVSGRLLTSLARLFTSFLQNYRGFTLGVEDILCVTAADSCRAEIIEETKSEGLTTVAKTLNVKRKNDVEEVTAALQNAHLMSRNPLYHGEDRLAAVDHSMKKISNSVNDQIAKSCTGQGLLKTFPANNLQLMVISGAKGGAVNCMQISCLLGQIELEGRRPPLMPSGRSAPGFKPYDTTLRAGGFISQRFLTGIRPQEYYYHCMAGREGLVDTAVKTSRSGYLQRCLIKHLEGLLLSYDMTVRDSDGSVLQFTYGEDGIDVTKSSYLNKKQTNFVVQNRKAIEQQMGATDRLIDSLHVSSSIERRWKKFDKLKRKCERRARKSPEDAARKQRTALLDAAQHASADDEQLNRLFVDNKSELIQRWRELDAKSKSKRKSSKLRLPDPILSQYRADLMFGSVSERYHEQIAQQLTSVGGGMSRDRFEAVMKLRYQRALCEPGESVGLIAAQSIGEPSTQMTLNTFHFAGRGEMNVTLGIPRLREILLVASKQLKTPQLTIPVKEEMQKSAKLLCKKLTRVKLAQVLNKFTLEERLVVGAGERYRRCVIHFHLLPQQQFARDLALNCAAVLRHIERSFIRSLLLVITKQMKKRKDEDSIVDQRVARELSRRQQHDDLDDVLEVPDADEDTGGGNEEEGDGDAGSEEQRRRRREDVDYEEQDNVAEGDDADPNDEDENVLEPVDDNSFDGRQREGDEPEEGGVADEGGVTEQSKAIRVSSVRNLGHGNIEVEDYDFDTVDESWCKLTIVMPLTSVQVDVVSLVREQAANSAVRQVPGLSRAILVPAQSQAAVDQGQVNLVTEGINFPKIFDNEQCLHVNRLYCNCVHSVARIYGIEAARRVIVKEIANVFAVYGIEVDPRHLILVADYMCFEGEYKAFNRVAIQSCASPLQQMSFETTMKFLNAAALFGSSDKMQSPSARIVAGQVVRAGTGNFSVHYPVASSLCA